MKCEACQYDDSIIDKILFKRGPRKGQVKSEHKRRKFMKVGLRVDKPEIRLGDFSHEMNIDAVFIDNEYRGYGYGSDHSEIGLYACPECSTVRVEHW